MMIFRMYVFSVCMQANCMIHKHLKLLTGKMLFIIRMSCNLISLHFEKLLWYLAQFQSLSQFLNLSLIPYLSLSTFLSIPLYPSLSQSQSKASRNLILSETQFHSLSQSQFLFLSQSQPQSQFI